MYLQREVELLFTVSFVVQALLQPQDATLLLLVTDHVELLLLISGHNAEGQLSVFSSVSVLCSQLQNLTTNRNVVKTKQVLCMLGNSWNSQKFCHFAKITVFCSMRSEHQFVIPKSLGKKARYI